MRILSVGEIITSYVGAWRRNQITMSDILIAKNSYWKVFRVERRGADDTLYLLEDVSDRKRRIELTDNDLASIFNIEKAPVQFKATTCIDNGDDLEILTENLSEAKKHLKRVCAKGFIQFRRGKKGSWTHCFDYDSRSGFKRVKGYRGLDQDVYVRFETPKSKTELTLEQAIVIENLNSVNDNMISNIVNDHINVFDFETQLSADLRQAFESSLRSATRAIQVPIAQSSNTIRVLDVQNTQNTIDLLSDNADLAVNDEHTTLEDDEGYLAYLEDDEGYF